MGDPKVFLVDLRSPEQLMAPWPLPPAPQSGKMHDFEQAEFAGPHFCDHCLGFIKNPFGAYCCSCCQFRVHRASLAKARKVKSCWKTSKNAEDTEDQRGGFPPCGNCSEDADEGADVEAHVHQMSRATFPRPTQCGTCHEYIRSMRGYQCIECRRTSHSDCLDRLKGCVILEEESVCYTC